MTIILGLPEDYTGPDFDDAAGVVCIELFCLFSLLAWKSLSNNSNIGVVIKLAS